MVALYLQHTSQSSLQTTIPTTTVLVTINKKTVTNYWSVVIICVAIGVALNMLYWRHLRRRKKEEDDGKESSET